MHINFKINRLFFYSKLSKRLIGFMAFILFFSVSPCLRGGLQQALAAGTRTLTLDQAITIAMEQNRDIEKAREYAKYVQRRYIEER